MAHPVTMFETDTDQPTIHPTLQEAVMAELTQLLGHEGSAGNTVIPALARRMADRPDLYIACLEQLTTTGEPQ